MAKGLPQDGDIEAEGGSLSRPDPVEAGRGFLRTTPAWAW